MDLSGPTEFTDIVLATVDGEHSITLMLHKPDSRLVPMARHTDPDASPPPAYRSSPPSSYSPPPAYRSKRTLSLKLGAVIDNGATAVVYDVEIEDKELKHILPPLAVKIARPSRQRRLEREKFFYDYMQESQGVILARCYGLYKGEATSSVAVDLWAQDLDISEVYAARRYMEGEERVEGEEYAEVQAYVEAHYNDPKDSTAHLLATPGPHTHLSILVLEKLGAQIPIGVKLSPDLIEDVKSMGHDLEYHGVGIEEPRWCNILAAPSGPLSLPSVHSPHSNRVHNWRIIDLEAGCQSYLSYRKGETAWAWGADVGRFLDSLPSGYVMEPWLI